MYSSARNQFQGTVKSIKEGAVNSEVVFALPGGQEIVAAITCESVKELDLNVGKPVVALVKTGHILLVAGEPALKLSARNRLTGTIRSIDKGAVNTIVELDLGDGTLLSAGITLKSTEQLQLATGQTATAVFKANAVILGVQA